jgi:hemoglobin-like flavoprotein
MRFDVTVNDLISSVSSVIFVTSRIKAYGAIADAFIGLEKDIYKQMAWEGFKPFEVTNITEE